MRLSGVFLVAGESEWAVIEFANGEQQIVRAGDKLPHIGSVTKILPTGIRLETPKGPRLVNLAWRPNTGGESPTPPSAAPNQQDGHVMASSLRATPDVLSAIARVAGRVGASDADLTQALIPLLDLPSDARVSGFFPGEPEREAKGVAEVSATLARGQLVRLHVEAGGQKQTIYMTPGQPPGAGSAGPNVQNK